MDKTLLNKMGLNGYEYAKKHFDRVELSKTYIKEINNIFAS